MTTSCSLPPVWKRLMTRSSWDPPESWFSLWYSITPVPPCLLYLCSLPVWLRAFDTALWSLSTSSCCEQPEEPCVGTPGYHMVYNHNTLGANPAAHSKPTWGLSQIHLNHTPTYWLSVSEGSHLLTPFPTHPPAPRSLSVTWQQRGWSPASELVYMWGTSSREVSTWGNYIRYSTTSQNSFHKICGKEFLSISLFNTSMTKHFYKLMYQSYLKKMKDSWNWTLTQGGGGSKYYHNSDGRGRNKINIEQLGPLVPAAWQLDLLMPMLASTFKQHVCHQDVHIVRQQAL